MIGEISGASLEILAFTGKARTPDTGVVVGHLFQLPGPTT
jgi:hypothetical protein